MGDRIAVLAAAASLAQYATPEELVPLRPPTVRRGLRRRRRGMIAAAWSGWRSVRDAQGQTP